MNTNRATTLVQQWVVVTDEQGAHRLVARWVHEDAQHGAGQLAAA